ncbi:MAG: tetratricopeptide repeat protein [Alphaproteobacteria bacterium]|nr:tetratricopeptide repeat protein [Alphaproteobacteria bacterium]MDE2631464.1 tetratricopeptide repeat protein [Alphaproteobacteria bacterium]
MHKHIVLAAFIAIGLALPAHADTTPAPTAEQPWVKAQTLLDATLSDLSKGGIMAVAAHVSDLEQALAEAPQAIAAGHAETGTITVLTDGPTDTLIALSAAAADKNAAGRQTVAVNNPYPPISLYLGSYYNEIGKPEEALRVLDAGLKLYGMRGVFGVGAHRPLLISERGAALASLKRWPEALANYDEGLALTGIDDRDRARLYRGRGFALTELGRLDEAEQAYRDSLKLDPDSKIAEGELDYIARLRAGGAKEPGGITLPAKTP